MIDTSLSRDKFLNLTSEYFSVVGRQEEDPDLFTAVRRNVISYVETAPLQACDRGWVYDHTLVSSTITSEVRQIRDNFTTLYGIICLQHNESYHYI